MKGKSGLIAAAVLALVGVLVAWVFSDRSPKGRADPTSSGADQIEAYLAKLGIQRYAGMVEAADFELPDLGGKPVRLSTFRGTLVFLNFWATWCPACRVEMPSMEKLYKAFKDKGFAMLAVSSDAGGAKIVGPFMRKYRLTFPALLDPDGRVTRMYQVRGIPTTVLIDQEGRVIGRAVGARDWASPEARRMIELLLAEGSSLLPTHLKGLRLQSTVQGQAAEAMINRLHNKEVTSKDSYIGHYQGQGAKAVLYVSEFQSQQEAEALLASMSDRIKTSSKVFGHFRQMRERGLTVYSVLGLGQVHYFYRQGHVLIWLAVDPGVAQEAFEAVLGKSWGY